MKSLKLSKTATVLACLQLVNPLVFAADHLDCNNDQKWHINPKIVNVAKGVAKGAAKGTAFMVAGLGVGFCLARWVSECDCKFDLQVMVGIIKTKCNINEKFCAELGKDYLKEFEGIYESLIYNKLDDFEVLLKFFDEHFVNVAVPDEPIFDTASQICSKCIKNPFYTMRSGKRIFISGADRTDFGKEYVFWTEMKQKIDSSPRPELCLLSERIYLRLHSLRKILEDKGEL